MVIMAWISLVWVLGCVKEDRLSYCDVSTSGTPKVAIITSFANLCLWPLVSRHVTLGEDALVYKIGYFSTKTLWLGDLSHLLNNPAFFLMSCVTEKLSVSIQTIMRDCKIRRKAQNLQILSFSSILYLYNMYSDLTRLTCIHVSRIGIFNTN